MLTFIRFLDARSDAEGARSSEEQTTLGHGGAVFGSGALRCAVPRRSPGVIASVSVTRYTVTRYDQGNTMAAAERMRAMRERRQASGLRELRLVVPDARSKAIRRRIAKEVAGLDRARELTALGWIEAVSEFDRE